MSFFDFFKRLRLFCVRFTLFSLILISLTGVAFGVQFGLEVELASEHLMETHPENIPDSMYTQPLEVVRDALGDSTGEIQIVPWAKEGSLREAVYVDPQGRHWQVVPEYLNTTSYDGFELVTPPFRDSNEALIFKEILQRILDGGDYGKGIRSSVHVTLDVSSLFDREGDASKLVDTLLFIENHWPEIYSLIGPIRYGTLVNYFSVPLALEQKNLLTELSSLTAPERTYSRVRDLFTRYQNEEREYKGGVKAKGAYYRSWKYRAANYKKLFQLAGERFLPVIEFRIMDFQDPEAIFSKAELLNRIIEDAHRIEPKGRVRDPLEGIHSQDMRAVNRFIYETGFKDGGVSERVITFLHSLNLSEASLQPPKGLERNPFFDFVPTEWAALQSEYDSSQTLVFAGRPITFGFEMEMRGSRINRLVRPNGDQLWANVQEYPFLEEKAEREESFNVEVKSKPCDTLETVIQQMKLLKGEIGSDLKGFHLHIRVPGELADRVPTEELNGWFSRISDSITAWRLEKRRPFFALKAWSQRRLPPVGLGRRGTVRVRRIGNSLDIELRGLMGNVSGIREYARKIILGLLRPELIRGFPNEQSLLHFQTLTLTESIQQFVHQYEDRNLSLEEVAFLEDLGARATRDGILPLYGFEFAPYFSELERIPIRSANLVFRKRVADLLRDRMRENSNDAALLESYRKKFRELIKAWAKGVRLTEALERVLLLPPSVISNEWLLENARDSQEKLERAYCDPTQWRFIRTAARNLLCQLNPERFPERISGGLAGEFDGPMEGIDPPRDSRDSETDVLSDRLKKKPRLHRHSPLK